MRNLIVTKPALIAGKGEERVKMFAQISPETVNLIAETLGITSSTQGSSAALDPKVTRALAEDASYRVREVVNLAAQILKHSKRRRLTTTDLNKVWPPNLHTIVNCFLFVKNH